MCNAAIFFWIMNTSGFNGSIYDIYTYKYIYICIYMYISIVSRFQCNMRATLKNLPITMTLVHMACNAQIQSRVTSNSSFCAISAEFRKTDFFRLLLSYYLTKRSTGTTRIYFYFTTFLDRVVAKYYWMHPLCQSLFSKSRQCYCRSDNVTPWTKEQSQQKGIAL